ncbi:hypothetical protein ASD8599_03273 [Ascidiaceihabitans donghaensis]|uniref:Uncharacterized protein n=1 Tax=Ascidiaceihabitans donghaensis TaxID=1510460 RepID=A0A2R8BHH4_9RHOB|nr:hypothetical protein [Ascidiaceihabitans donghaensis]SPH22529.1 hypothetical protein ASD8599_03273 [Ascidiaceihabitans donghaensis]
MNLAIVFGVIMTLYFGFLLTYGVRFLLKLRKGDYDTPPKPATQHHSDHTSIDPVTAYLSSD